MHRGQGETRERGGHFRLLDGRFNQQGNIYEACLEQPREASHRPPESETVIQRPS